MAGLLLRKKNNKLRYNKDRNYLKTIINNTLLHDNYLNKEISLIALNKLNTLKNSSISKIKNKCLLSGRNRAVYKRFRLSRMFIKNLGVSGYINGLKKTSW